MSPTTKLSDEKLREIIWEGLRLEKVDGAVNMYFPSDFFGYAGGTPLCISIRRLKSEKVNTGPLKQSMGCIVDDNKYEEFEITDGGRAMSELLSRVGNAQELMPIIERILYKSGMHTLRGGRIICRSYDVYADFLHASRLNSFLMALSLISNLDIISKDVDEDDEDYEAPTPCNEKAKKRHGAPNEEVIDKLYANLRDIYKVDTRHDEQRVFFGIFLDDESSNILFNINPDKTMTVKTDSCFSDWIWHPFQPSEGYTTSVAAIVRRYGLSFDEKRGELSLTFRRNEMTVAAAIYRITAALLSIYALEWCVGV